MTGVVTGFDYAGVEVVMKANSYNWDVFKQFQTIEIIALNFWNKD